MKRMSLLIVVLGTVSILFAAHSLSQTPYFGGGPGGYDTNYILCCGKDLNGRPFCTNMMRDDCFTYSGRQVASCSECLEAPDYTLFPPDE